jgi:hypothetical protein
MVKRIGSRIHCHCLNYIFKSHTWQQCGGGGDSSYKHLLSGHALPLDSSSFSERDEAAILE